MLETLLCMLFPSRAPPTRTRSRAPHTAVGMMNVRVLLKLLTSSAGLFEPQAMTGPQLVREAVQSPLTAQRNFWERITNLYLVLLYSRPKVLRVSGVGLGVERTPVGMLPL